MKTIIRTSIVIVLFQLYSFNLFSQSPPQIWKLCIKGVVTYIDDRENLFGGSISEGDSIYGNIIYDISIPNPNPLGTVSDYQYYLSPNGIQVNINNRVFQTDPNNVDFIFEICNNHWGIGDAFVMRSYNNVFIPAISGMNDTHISWQCDDPSETAVSNTDILTSINLDSWQQWSGLSIDGRTEDYENIFIRAIVTNVEVCNDTPGTVIPLSNWALFIGIGLILVFAVLRFRKVI